MKKHVKVAAGLVFEKGRIFATKRGEARIPILLISMNFRAENLNPEKAALIP